MVRKYMLSVVAMIVILGLVIAGCPTTLPDDEPAPVEVIVYMRTEDERLAMGDYMSDQLEDLGFTVTRVQGTSAVCNPVVYGEPSLGEWQVYTEGWVSGAVPRDEGWVFGFMYTTLGEPYMGSLWAAYGPITDASFYRACEKLWDNDFSTMDERKALFEIALWGHMETSLRIGTNQMLGFDMLRADTNVAADGAGGIAASALWAYTAHKRDAAGAPAPGGTIKMALRGLLSDPLNPIGGSNWLWDSTLHRAMSDRGTFPDTRDGLYWPGRIEKADVVHVAGLPIGQSLGVTPPHTWLDLDFRAAGHADLTAPDEAWADWDAANQSFITVAEKMDSASAYYDADFVPTVQLMSRAYYPAGTFGIKLHDGSDLSMADFLLGAILTFDRAKEDSDIYDEGAVSAFNSFMATFRGVKFITDEPGYDLIVETWTNSWSMDAELSVLTWFPMYRQGQGVWHTLGIGIKAEAEEMLAFTQAKADTLEVDWTNFVGGDALAELKSQLAGVIAAGSTYAPYKTFIADEYAARGLGDFDAEIADRWAKLDAFVAANNHFWVGSGPMYLQSVDAINKAVVLKRHADYPDDADRWLFLMDVAPTGLGHTGAWVDEVIISVETNADAALAQLKAGAIDMFGSTQSDPALLAAAEAEPAVTTKRSVGNYNGYSFNPVGPFFPEDAGGKLNPFALKAVREAMNWAIDREYIVGTIMGGGAIPKYTALNPVGADESSPDRSKAVVDAIKEYYAYDLAKADAAIEAAMLTIPGVTRGPDGKYGYLAPGD